MDTWLCSSTLNDSGCCGYAPAVGDDIAADCCCHSHRPDFDPRFLWCKHPPGWSICISGPRLEGLAYPHVDLNLTAAIAESSCVEALGTVAGIAGVCCCVTQSVSEARKSREGARERLELGLGVLVGRELERQ